MGSWGPGLFENDTAQDYIGNLSEKIIQDIELDLAGLGDGILERPVGACLSILNSLSKSYPFLIDTLSASDIERWRMRLNQWLKSTILEQESDKECWNSFSVEVNKVLHELFQSANKQIP